MVGNRDDFRVKKPQAKDGRRACGHDREGGQPCQHALNDGQLQAAKPGEAEYALRDLRQRRLARVRGHRGEAPCRLPVRDRCHSWSCLLRICGADPTDSAGRRLGQASVCDSRRSLRLVVIMETIFCLRAHICRSSTPW